MTRHRMAAERCSRSGLAPTDRLTVIHLDQSGGPGNARNVGLGQATGQYVWFVDGDDAAAPGAIDAIRADWRPAGLTYC